MPSTTQITKTTPQHVKPKRMSFVLLLATAAYTYRYQCRQAEVTCWLPPPLANRNLNGNSVFSGASFHTLHTIDDEIRSIANNAKNGTFLN
jgi:hypothetical protein